MHVELEKGPPASFRESLTRFLTEQDLEFNRVVAEGRQATVEMCYHADKAAVISKLQRANLGQGVVVTATNVEVKAAREARPARLDTVRLTDVARSYDEALRELGFHALLDQQPRRVVREEDVVEEAVIDDDEEEGGDSNLERKAKKRKMQALMDPNELKAIFDK